MPPRRKDKKLKLIAAESGEDRISALLNDLVHHVLSFLPADEAVQTCVLSRRWREFWKSMPVLRVTEAESWGSPAEFNKFVNHLLFFRDLVPLEEFEFRTYLYQYQMLTEAFNNSVEPVWYVDMWIQYALMRKVRVLRVVVKSRDKTLQLVNVPLISKQLVTLELACVILEFGWLLYGFL